MGILDGKIAIVTGGSSGIGRATALAMGEAGATVVVANRTEATGQEVVKLIKDAGGSATWIGVDVTNPKQVQALIDKTVAAYGRVDCAFNNAGIAGVLADTATCTQKDWDINMNINLRSVFLCMQAEINQMLKQEAGGAIVNTSSAAGRVGLPGAAAYTAAKWAVEGVTKAAAAELVKKNIRVNTVAPAFVETPLTAGVAQNFPEFVQHIFPFQIAGRMAKPEEVASAVVWMCSDGASFVTGHSLSVDGGYVAM
ncbi:MAG: SDR family oxidoreductase [Phycisphaerae bacterium]|nr:SDR family oxidoreductase [Phycisphaerae bacterium]